MDRDRNSTNSFVNGFYSAVNWEQTSRLQTLWVARNARISTGRRAYQNNTEGKPLVENLRDDRRKGGQIIFVAQRVDRPALPEYRNDAVLLAEALEKVNMNETADSNKAVNWNIIKRGQLQ